MARTPRSGLIILLIAAAIILIVFACERPSPTPTPPPPSPTPTPEPTPEPTAIERLAWFDARPDTAHWIAWNALRRMAIDDEPLTQQIASLDWVVDGITAEEAGALDDVSWLLRENPAIADTALNLPWMATDSVISAEDRRALRAIRAAASTDEDLGATLAGYEWLTNGLTQDEAEALETIGEIVTPGFTTQTATGIGAIRLDRSGTATPPSVSPRTLQFATSVSQFPWMQDDVTSLETVFIANLNGLVETAGSMHAGAADTIVSYDWIQDGIELNESRSPLLYEPLFRAAGVEDTDILPIMLEYEWIADGLGSNESRAISGLTPLLNASSSDDVDVMRTMVSYPWLTDSIEGPEYTLLDEFAYLLRLEESAGATYRQTVLGYDWLLDDVTPTEIAFIHELTELTRTADDFHAESLDIVASYDWAVDGIDEPEVAFLRRLTLLFEHAGTEDAVALQTVLGYEWITDGVIVSELDFVRKIAYLFNASSQEDAQAITIISEYPWLADSVEGFYERDALRAFDALLRPQGSQYVVPQETILAFDWVSDGMSVYGDVYEHIALADLVETILLLASERPELMVSFVESEWLLDSLSFEERDGLSRVRDIVPDIKLLNRLVDALPYTVNDELTNISVGDEWLQGQFSDSFLEELHSTQQILAQRISLIDRVSNALDVAPEFAWLQDGLSPMEMEWLLAFNELFDVIGQPEALNFASLPWFQDNIDAFDMSVMNLLMWRKLILRPEIADLNLSADGISENDGFYLMALGDALNRSEHQYQDLLNQHHIASRTLTMPLAGDIDVTVVRHTPFPNNDPTLDLTEDIALQLEEFMGVPFPLDNILILILEASVRNGERPMIGVAYAIWGHLVMVPPRHNPGFHLAVFHEVSHLYWGGHTGAPPWWTEGAAGFLPDIARDALGHETLEERRKQLLWDTSRECWNQGIRTVSTYYHLQRTQPHVAQDRGICIYALGEIFLVEMYLLLGHDATSTAMRQLYVDARDSGWLDPITDQKIYDAFRANTPDDKVEEFRKLFLRLHGGANVNLSESTT